METQQLTDGTHTINATVGKIPEAYTYCIDRFEVVPNSGTAGPTSPARKKLNVSAIVGGGIGGIIALATLIIIYCLRRSEKRSDRRSQGNK